MKLHCACQCYKAADASWTKHRAALLLSGLVVSMRQDRMLGKLDTLARLALGRACSTNSIPGLIKYQVEDNAHWPDIPPSPRLCIPPTWTCHSFDKGHASCMTAHAGLTPITHIILPTLLCTSLKFATHTFKAPTKAVQYMR